MLAFFPNALYSMAGFPHGVLAQLVERLVRNEKVRGSNPLYSTIFFFLQTAYRLNITGLPMNGNLFKIVLISVIAILLAIIGGVMSADGDLISIGLASAPFVLIGLYLMKEKIWYLWVWMPILFIPFARISSYGVLFAYVITLPFYLWNAMLKRSSLTWNSIPFLDTAIGLLFIHIAYIFITHPFGLGINILEDYYGGKDYIMFLQAFIAYLSLSSLKTNSDQLGKVLQWSVVLSIIMTLITTVKGLISPDEFQLEMVEKVDISRNYFFLSISVLVLQLLIINYSITDIIRRPWLIAIGFMACIGCLISGFRSRIADLVILFFTVSLIYRRWVTCFAFPILGFGFLIVLSSAGVLKKLPSGVQRSLSAVSFLEVNSLIRQNAEGSVDWRVEMWEWALDDRENFINNKIFGDGFSRNISIFKANIYEEAYKLSHDQSAFAWNGQWHSGIIMAIQTMGYVGLSMYAIISVVGMIYAWIVSRLYLYHKYRLGILYVSAIYLTKPIEFAFLHAGSNTSIASEIVSLGIIKVLFCCAKREGLYVSFNVRKEYVPFMIQRTKEKTSTVCPAVVSS